MREPLAHHDGVLSCCGPHPGEALTTAARRTCPGMAVALYDGVPEVVPVLRWGGPMTHYLIATYDKPETRSTPAAALGPIAEAVGALINEAIETGIFLFAGGLHDQAASTVADLSGSVTDGPFLETPWRRDQRDVAVRRRRRYGGG